MPITQDENELSRHPEVQYKISLHLEDLSLKRERLEQAVEKINSGLSQTEVSKVGSRFVTNFSAADNEGNFYADIIDGQNDKLVRFILTGLSGQQFVEVIKEVEGGNFTDPYLGSGTTMRVKLVNLEDGDQVLKGLRNKEHKFQERLAQPAS